MSRRRFYVPRGNIRDGVAILPPDQAHHLANVLRMRSGDSVEVFDGEGGGYSGSVEIRAAGVWIRIVDALPSERAAVPVVLAAALIKSARFEWMLQKATELGADEIIPLTTRLCEIEIADGKIDSRLHRWNRIVQEASKQCRRYSAPGIRRPLDFRKFLELQTAAHSKFLFYEKSGNYWRPDFFAQSGPVLICLGPEGGWDEDEVEQAKNSGFQICSLGGRTLRAETAAIAALAIIQHHIGLQTSQS